MHSSPPAWSIKSARIGTSAAHPSREVPISQTQLAIIAIFCIACAITDWRSREIPNWLTGPAILIGFLVCPWPSSIYGFGLAVLIHIPFFILRYTSGGDVKLMAALGALMGYPEWLTFFVLQAILGGIVALIVSIASGKLLQVLRRMLHWGDKPLAVDDPKAITIPRGVVALGGLGLWLLARP